MGISVNCICPGATRTLGAERKIEYESKTQVVFEKVLPGGRWIEPKEVAQDALYLASDASSSVIEAMLVIDH